MGETDFGYAIRALKRGEKVTRPGWNGKGMWLALVNGYRGASATNPGGSREHLPWIGMRTADNKFVPWLASQTDVLAEDWEVLAEAD